MEQSYRYVPNLRFRQFNKNWERRLLEEICVINPKTEKVADEFIYIDLESVVKGELINKNIISKKAAPSRAQRVLRKGDICYQCVRPYQLNNYYFNNEDNDYQWVASTGYAQIRTDNNPLFLYQLLNSPRFNREVMLRCTGTSYPAINSNDLGEIEVAICSIEEQRKIACFLEKIDERISTQSKIIEDLIALKKWFIHRYYTEKNQTSKGKFCDYITQISTRNKTESVTDVLSVSNKNGFIRQNEQFEDREIASDDKHNYKIVKKDDFAYNPARINVGSIARLKNFDVGIVSPMYVCFRTNQKVLPEYLEYYFQSITFFGEMKKRLEGSVRQCLSYEALSEIKIFIPSLDAQKEVIKKLNSVENKIELEKQILINYQYQKKYLLSQMFI